MQKIHNKKILLLQKQLSHTQI